MTDSGKNKKILIFSIAYHPFIGGAEVAVKEIASRLKNYDFSVITLKMGKQVSSFERQGNVAIYRIGFPVKTGFKNSLNFSLVFNKYLFPFWATFKALKLNRKEKFNMTWSIMANYAGFAALFFKILKPRIPFLLTLQEGDPPEYIKKRVGILMPLYKMIFKKADKIQAISTFLSDYARQMGFEKEVSVVPNGVDSETFSREFSEAEIIEAKKRVNKKDGDVILITTSRLVRKNAVDCIIEALSFLPEKFKFFVAGQGEEEAEIKSLIDKFRLQDRVILDGFVPYEDLPLLLQVSDIFVRPSRSEGLGNSFLEAMASGIPVIGTPVGGIVDFLKDEETGLLVEVDEPKQLAEKIEKISTEPELYKNIVENGKKLVKEKYSWNSVSEKMNEIFQKLCAF